MALIKCLECGKEISDKATTCPNCGCPVNTIFRFRKPGKENVIYDRDGNEVIETTTSEATKNQGLNKPIVGKKSVVLIIAAIVALIAIIAVLIIINKNKKPEIIQQVSSIEAGTKVDYESILSSPEDNVLISKVSGEIDNKNPGEYELSYVFGFVDKEKRFEKKCMVEVVDTTAPDFTQNRKSFDYDEDVDLNDEKLYTVKDLCDKEPEVIVKSGFVDTSTPGDYDVTYIIKDKYGNSKDEKVTYHVNNKKYTMQEIYDYIEKAGNAMVDKGYNVYVSVDEYGGGVGIFYNIASYEKADKNRYYTLWYSVGAFGSDTPPIASNMSIYVYDKYDYVTDAWHFYLKSGDKQVDLADNALMYSNLEYDSGYCESNYVGLVGGIEGDVTETTLTFEEVLKQHDVKFRFDSELIVEGTLPDESIPIMLEIVDIYKTAIAMYEGTYEE